MKRFFVAALALLLALIGHVGAAQAVGTTTVTVRLWNAGAACVGGLTTSGVTLVNADGTEIAGDSGNSCMATFYVNTGDSFKLKATPSGTTFPQLVWAPNVRLRQDATTYVATGASQTVSFSVPTATTLRGYNQAGWQNTYVKALNPEQQVENQARVDANGNFRIDRLWPSTNYKVFYDTSIQLGHMASAWYGGGSSFSTATAVQASGQELAYPTLRQAGNISGTITSHQPTYSGAVDAYIWNLQGELVQSLQGLQTSGLAPGSYKVSACDPNNNNPCRYYPGVATFAEAATVTTTSGVPQTNINFVLKTDFANVTGATVAISGASSLTATISPTNWWPYSPTFVYTPSYSCNGVTSALPAQSGLTFAVSDAFRGCTLTLKTTASQTNYWDTDYLSGPVPIPLGVISHTGTIGITGLAQPAQVLTISSSAVSTTPGVQTSYSWYLDGVLVQGATSLQLTVQAGDVGKSISAKLLFSKVGYTTVELIANAGTAAFAVRSSQPTLAIAGTHALGQTLTATLGNLGVNDTAAVSWLCDGTPIQGLTGTTLQVGADQENCILSASAEITAPGHIDVIATSNLLSPPALASVLSLAIAADASGTRLTPVLSRPLYNGESITFSTGSSSCSISSGVPNCVIPVWQGASTQEIIAQTRLGSRQGPSAVAGQIEAVVAAIPVPVESIVSRALESLAAQKEQKVKERESLLVSGLAAAAQVNENIDSKVTRNKLLALLKPSSVSKVTGVSGSTKAAIQLSKGSVTIRPALKVKPSKSDTLKIEYVSAKGVVIASNKVSAASVSMLRVNPSKGVKLIVVYLVKANGDTTLVIGSEI
jgi:hypothetical protein